MSDAATNRWRTVLRWLVGGLLLWAAVSKLANPTDFLASIYAYQVPLPAWMQKGSAVFLPWIELLCALLLLANLWTASALLCSFLLFCVFILATGQAWARGLDISCGCFDFSLLGLGPQTAAVQHLLESVSFAFFRNLLLAGVVFWLWRRETARQPVLASQLKPSHTTAA